MGTVRDTSTVFGNRFSINDSEYTNFSGLFSGLSRDTQSAPAEETSPVTKASSTVAVPQVMEISVFSLPAAMASDLFEVGAYPNPSNTDFKLNISSASSETIRVTVYDMFGRAVKYFSFASKPSITLGQDLKAGVYMIEVRQGKNVKTLKGVKF